MKVARTVWTYTKSEWIVRDGDEGDTPDSAIEIIVDAPAERYQLLSPDDHNWYKFQAVAGETYIIETFNSEPYDEDDHEISMDPYIYLYDSDILTDPTTSEIDSDDDSGTTQEWEARIEFTPTVSGTYYIILRHYDSDYNITGSYDISVVTEVDKTALTDLIAVAEGLDEADYEDDAAWAALPAAIAAAQAVADDEDATQDEVDQAVLDLQDAIDALVPIAAPTVEFTAVKYSLNAEYTVTSTSVPGATRYSIITVAGGVETESDIKDIGEILSGAINATITIKVYDGSDVLLHTFEDVPTGLTP